MPTKKTAQKTTKKRKSAKKRSVPKTPVPVAVPSGEGSVSVRKIQNGFIVRTEKYERGKYKVEEVFSQTNPIKIGG